MKKSILFNISSLILTIGVSNIVFGQIGFNSTNNHPSTILTIDADETNNLYGVGVPVVELQGVTMQAPFKGALKEGLSVFNTANTNDLKSGYYFWNGSKWIMMDGVKEEFVIYQKIDTDVLGYVPKDNIGSWVSGQFYNITANGSAKTAKLEKCVTWIEDEVSEKPGYQYCAFTLSSGGLTWPEAFNFSKSIGGYLVTIPQTTEWNYIKRELIDLIPLNGNIWIGYNKIQAGGNTTRSKWITGEKWSINWVGSGSTGATVQSNFVGSEPNNDGGNEGCTHIIRKGGGFPDVNGGNMEFKWNDAVCNQSSGYWGDYNQIIVKFGGLKD